MASRDIESFEALLDYLARTRGFDFTAYKRSSLTRRVHRRLQDLPIATYTDYMDYLEVHPEEFVLLFNTILINVTSFFRDEEAWAHLAQEIIPRILEGKGADEPIRVWSAGCASGEEAYSLAMLFAEALGQTAFRQRVKIYATDVDEEALTAARQATYSAKGLESVPEALRGRYFAPIGGNYAFDPELRRSVIFGRHDLTQDAPISRLDLLVCRNTLMYFNSEAQAKIMARFHFALGSPGYLFLGKAEMMIAHSNLFEPVELKYRIFGKSAKTTMRNHLVAVAQAGDLESVNSLGRHSRLRDVTFDTSPTAQLVIDANGCLALANERARVLFGLTASDLGRPLQDLEFSYRPLELRSIIEQIYAEHRAVRVPNVERHFPDGNTQYFDVQVTPLSENEGSVLGVSVSFDDVSYRQKLQTDLRRSTQELETAYEELQSTHEELETTNEELQSTNEELETTNEELQSTNEELETMNEELQSTNEELETSNAELRSRTDEVTQTNGFLRSILASVNVAIIVVDRELRVLAWNARAEDMWGVRAEEAQGQFLLTLDIGLPIDQLPVAQVASGKKDHAMVTLEATNRRGKSIRCQARLMPLYRPNGDPEGAIIVIDELNKAET